MQTLALLLASHWHAIHCELHNTVIAICIVIDWHSSSNLNQQAGSLQMCHIIWIAFRQYQGVFHGIFRLFILRTRFFFFTQLQLWGFRRMQLKCNANIWGCVFVFLGTEMNRRKICKSKLNLLSALSIASYIFIYLLVNEMLPERFQWMNVKKSFHRFS